MKTNILITIRVVLGIGLIIFGLDKFFTFVPHNHVMDKDLIAAFHGLMANKFILPTVGVVELLSGLLLLTKKFNIIGLLMMIPVTYGIIAFHIAVDIQGIIPGLIVAILHLVLLIDKRSLLMRLIDA